MSSEVTVKFSDEKQFNIHADAQASLTDEAARNWLSQAYEDFGCEPLNPVGKVLAVDKVLCVARAAGPGLFADATWAATFAKAAQASLKRSVVRIDVEGMTVGY